MSLAQVKSFVLLTYPLLWLKHSTHGFLEPFQGEQLIAKFLAQYVKQFLLFKIITLRIQESGLPHLGRRALDKMKWFQKATQLPNSIDLLTAV